MKYRVTLSMVFVLIFLVMFLSIVPMISTTFAKIQNVPGRKESQGIELNGIPVNLFVDSAANRLYVTLNNPSVLVIDLNRDTINKTINLDRPVYAMDIDSITNKIYLSSLFGNNIHVLDAPTATLIGNFTIGDNSSGISVDASNSAVYVANPNSGNVSKIVTTSNTVFEKYNLTNHPSDVQVIPKTGDVYIVTPENVWRLIAKSNKIDKNPIANGAGLGGIAINRATDRVYVADFLENTILVIDADKNQEVGKISVGKYPISIAVNSNTNKIYVSNSGEGTISVINGTTNMRMDTIGLGGTLTSIGVNPITNTLYVADTSKRIVHIVDGTTGSEVYGIRFNVKPPKSGILKCIDRQNTDENPILVNISTFYHRYNNGTDFHCEAERLPGTAFDHWEGVLPKNLTMNPDDQAFSYFFGASQSTNTNKPETNFVLLEHGTNATAVFADSISIAAKYGNTISIISVILSMISVPLYSLKKKRSGIITNEEYSFIGKTTENGDNSSDILTIDGSIIAGVLILLSIGQGVFEVKQLALITANIVFPFATSAICALVKKTIIAKRFALAGCLNFMVSISLLIIISTHSRL